MRLLYGGLLFLLLLATSASAQITGQVEFIGFDGMYRPGCWTPMLVRLKSAGSPTDFYELRVWQYDLDGDRPYFSRRVNVNADKGEQSFWTYFIPEPIQQGLTSPGSSELSQRLRITVHDKAGKELAQIPLGSATAQEVDPSTGGFDRTRARRFVLFVGASPPLRDFAPESIVGLQEDLASQRLQPERLPENAVGYEGIDAIVWLDGDPAQLSQGQSERFDALRDYVRMGGKLILGTPPQWQQLAGFEDLLPVDISGVELNELQSPVKQIANEMRFPPNAAGAPRANPWLNFRKPFSIATALPKPNAVVDRFADRVENPTTPADQTPWLVRMPYGYGSVVWVGQDLGNRELTNSANWGWPAVWEDVFGTPSNPLAYPTTAEKARYQSNGNIDYGYVVMNEMNLSARSAVLVGVTIGFFILYWIIVGPGAHFLLKFKGRATLSWFVFGAIALAATGVTLLVVRVMLRGAPEMRHISLVRVMNDKSLPAMVVSRMGVYIPRDGAQEFSLGKGDARFSATITPFPIHPTVHSRNKGDQFLFPAPREYRVPVPGSDDASVADVSIPFRTTMKRLRATWAGPMDARLDGEARLTPAVSGQGYIAGTLRNLTGANLINIYVAFRHQPEGVDANYWMMHVPKWDAGTDLDLAAAFNPPAGKRVADISINNPISQNEVGTFPVRGQLRDWMERFRSDFAPRNQLDNLTEINDLPYALPRSVWVLSLFNALGVVENQPPATDRRDLHRSGVRDFDVSGALQAGQLVVLAQRDSAPLPMPLNIEGEPVEGIGRTIYQFILPLKPLPVTAPPSTSPTTARNP